LKHYSKILKRRAYRRVLLLTFFILHSTFFIQQATAQEARVQNRPYTDLRPMHFGIVVGTNLQETEFRNVGLTTLKTGEQSEIYCDQESWDFGFNVGVLMEARISQYFAFRAAPQLYFGTHNFRFYNKLHPEENREPKTQQLRTVYVGANLDLIFAAQRWNNHRPYIMAGIAPMINLTNTTNDYIQFKKSEVFLEVGLGCDFYLPFFKLRPELKFMYGLTNAYDTNRDIKEDNPILPYASAVDKATNKMIVLSFYFE
jgi:hypothetical protein